MGGVVPANALTPAAAGHGCPPLRLRRRLWWIGAALAAWLVFRVLLSFPDAAEVLVGAGPLPWLARFLSRLTGTVPVSLVELVVVGVVARQIGGAVAGIRQVRLGLDRWARTLLRGGLRVAQDVAILVVLFYGLWGFQYARPGLAGQLGLDAAGQLEAGELESLSVAAVQATNGAYLTLHGSEDAGAPTATPAVRSLVPALEEGWSRVRAEFELPHRLEQRHGAPKPLLATPVLKRMGVRGIFIPYTGEAVVPRDLPGVQMGTTLAHEMAHQRGITAEADANVLAFLVASRAPDPRLRYAAHRFLEGQLVAALARDCLPCAEEVIRERLPGVRRDLAHAAEYWSAARGPVRDAATRANHAMLRSHGIAEGTASYGGSTWILAALALRDGPEVLFGTGE